MLNTSDRRGGAAVAASRLREALGATLIVGEKLSDDPNVILLNDSWFRKKIGRFRFLWERLTIFLQNGLSRENLFKVSIANTGIDVSKLREIREADIIHLHWFNQGFLSLRDVKKLLALGKPVVWTLHDMWPATGICHHAWACVRYREGCGKCPFLNSSHENDLSARIFRRKRALYGVENLTLVPVSEWLAEKCRTSTLTAHLPVHSIPNPIDTDFFSPGDRAEARREAGLSTEKRILLMGAARIDDPVKGFALLREALEKLAPEIRENALLVLFGRIKEPGILADLPVAVDWRGMVADARTLRTLYRAADLTVSASHYETFGQTLSEALACGCPAVAFGNSGQREVIDHRLDGWLARYPDAEEFARGIEWVLGHPDPAELAAHGRGKVVERFSAARVAEEYREVYKSLRARPQAVLF